MSPGLSLDAARAHIPITRERVYLSAGSYGPLTVQTRDRLEHFLAEWASFPPDQVDRWDAEYAATRASFAPLIGADADEVLLTENTSHGLNLVAQMVPCPPGSNVVFADVDHPNAVWPWKLREAEGPELRCVRSVDGVVEPAAIERAVDGRTVAVVCSQVTSGRGFRQDVPTLVEIAHRAGALVVLDTAQATGALVTDVHRDGVDFLACPSYKWLLGPPSGGFLYVARRHHERLRPPHVGLSAAEPPYRLDRIVYRPGSLRYQTGFPNYLGAVAVRPGLELLRAVGMEAVQAQVERLAGHCLMGLRERGFEVLTPLDPARRAGLVTFRAPESERLHAWLAGRGIDIGLSSDGTLRVDPHFYNTEAEIATLFDALETWRRELRPAQ